MSLVPGMDSLNLGTSQLTEASLLPLGPQVILEVTQWRWSTLKSRVCASLYFCHRLECVSVCLSFLCMSVYLCACVCVCEHIYLYLHMCLTYVHVCECKQVHMCVGQRLMLASPTSAFHLVFLCASFSVCFVFLSYLLRQSLTLNLELPVG